MLDHKSYYLSMKEKHLLIYRAALIHAGPVPASTFQGRVFSIGGQVFSARRAALSVAKGGLLVLLKHNKKLVRILNKPPLCTDDKPPPPPPPLPKAGAGA